MSMDVNRGFARIDGGGALAYAPRTLVLDGRVYVSPSSARYAEAGWLPVEAAPPDPPDGKRVKAMRYEVAEGRIVPVYEYEDAAPGPVLVSKSKVEAAIDRMGKTAEFVAWLNSRAVYVGAWTRGGDTIIYNPSDNSGDLASLVAALGVSDEQVAAILAGEEVDE